MKFLLSVILFFALCAGICLAQIPRTIPYQGLLYKGNSVASDGNHSIIFSLYDTPTGGTLLYSETQNITTSHGLFSVVVGSVTPIPLTLTFDKVYFSAVAVDGQPEESPRSAFTSVPYSLNASVASGLSSDAKIPKNLFSLSSTPGGPAGGDLRSFYPAPIVSGFRDQPVTNDTPHFGDGLIWNGKGWNLHSFTKPVTFMAVGDTTMIISNTYQGQINLVADSTNGSVEDSNYVNIKSDVFTAPEKGIYGFIGTFIISAENMGLDSLDYFPAGLLVNNVVMCSQTLSHSVFTKLFTINYSTTISLKAGDKVGIFIERQSNYGFGLQGFCTVKSSKFAGYKIN